jgi:hypothetical protein
MNEPPIAILLGCVFALAAVGSPELLADEQVRPGLVKIPIAIPKGMENTPVEFQGRRLLLMNRRDDAKVNTDGYVDSMSGYVVDLQTGEELAQFAQGFSFVSGIVDGTRLHAFASRGTNHDWFQDIRHFWTDDLVSWREEPAVKNFPDEHLFNTSVCRDDEGFVMAYESDKPLQFCFRFARSTDLSHWESVPGLVFCGDGAEYSACPCIRYFAPYYYVIYLHAAVDGHPGWISYLARSTDLATWQLSPLNPILEAGPGEGANNSDVDLIEFDGKTFLYYATGDQQTWCSLRMAMYPAPMREFFESWFPEGNGFREISARVESK